MLTLIQMSQGEIQDLCDVLRRDMRREQLLAAVSEDGSVDEHGYNVHLDLKLLELINPKHHKGDYHASPGGLQIPAILAPVDRQSRAVLEEPPANGGGSQCADRRCVL